MRRPWSLSAKMGAMGGALLLMALFSIGLTLWVTWQLEGGAAAVNEAGRMRMQTWRLAQTLAAGDAERAAALARQFDHSVALLRSGDTSRPLFVPRDARSQAAFGEVQRAWGVLSAAWSATPAPAAAEAARQAETFVARIDDFVSAIERQLARLTAILNGFQFVMMALVIASAVALMYSAYLFVFNPLARLQAGLARVGQGDLAARVDATVDDEFGALAAGFNRMAQTLQGLYQSLEAKVQEKTVRLEAQHARLAALYEAAAFVNRAATLDELAQGFARQVRRAAQADASAVRWSDEANRRYLLLASDCLPDALVREERCMPTGDCHCGQAQGDARTRVIPIRSPASDDLLGHCGKAGYETLISVPVRAQERMVGELDLFYRHATTLSDEDRALLETLASHLAGAVEGLRVGALERETAIAEERGLLARELHDSIAQSLAFLKIQVGLLRGALARRDTDHVEVVLGELDAGVQESLSDVRELLLHFRTRTNAEDIAPALQTTLRKFEHQTGMRTQLSIEGDGLPLAADVQVQVLHVVQEALSNVRKHAGARQVWVDVQQAPPWRVEVRDDGIGFAHGDKLSDETHVGLRIMRERALRIGATVEVRSAAGSGTCVALTLPALQRRAA
ncbi:MAG TPA: type IV pili methyl-accepting chemotaxis transducer N-terminal domain-containing protein [Methylibium sp.]|nr:type IV pili methyl-accepting chemotaxis transducer N-terminal domain-containing protein [Methylibium sp.]